MGKKAEKARSWVRNRLKEIVIVGGIFGTISSIFVFGQMIGTLKQEVRSNAIDIAKVETKIDKVIAMLEAHGKENATIVAYYNRAKPQLNKLVYLQGRPAYKE